MPKPRVFVGVAALLAGLSLTTLLSTPDSGATSLEPPARCPTTIALESTNGSDYVAVFGSTSQMHVQIELELYSDDHDYSATIPDVAIDVPLETGEAFRSKAIDLRRSPAGQILGASVTAKADAESPVCPTEAVLVPSIASLTAPHRVLAPQLAALERSFAAEVGNGEHAVDLTPHPAAPRSCKEPFEDATLVMPAAITETNDGDIVTVRLSVDAAGNPQDAHVVGSSSKTDVDQLAIAAAMHSTYRPERFLCENRSSRLVVIVDFAGDGIYDPNMPQSSGLHHHHAHRRRRAA